MEKNGQDLMEGGSGMPNLAPPTAPPSYDEAIANADAGPRPYLPPSSAPYPTLGGPSMPMPNPYAQPSMAMPMPIPASNAQPQVHQYQPTSQYPQQQQHVAPQSYAVPQVQVIQQTVAYGLGPHSIKMSCPMCRADIKTTTVSDHQASAHICCIILCLLGCCLCSCLPYCMNAFMSVHHSCPNCKAYIGTWKG